MRLVGQFTGETRYVAGACFLAGAGFIGAKFGGALGLLAVPVGLLVALHRLRATGSCASWLTVDSQEVVAHFTFGGPERIPLARIAAVEIDESRWRSRTFEPVTLIRIFRRDEPAVIELHASASKADAFLRELARYAKRLGLSQLARFALPRRRYVSDLAPLIPALALLWLFPFPISWPAFAVALAVFVLHTALGWRKTSKHAKALEGGATPAAFETWLWLLTTARAPTAASRSRRRSQVGA
jgi:hypothetical protein